MRAALVFVALLVPASASFTEQSAAANPIRKVVTMLQVMQKKIAAEGVTETELFEKFECYCGSSGADLKASIAAAETKIPSVTSDIEEAESKVAQLKEDLKNHQVDRDAAKAAMASATAVREKEAAEFAKEKSESTTNIAALTAAIAALEKGMAGFLQTETAQFLRNMALNTNSVASYDRDELVSFLSGSANGQYAPKSGDVTGIIKQMKDTMAAGLAEAEAAEAASIKAYEELMAAKAKEIKALTSAIEDKTVRVGDLGVEIIQMKEDLSDTQKALLEDQKFLADLDANCATKKEEHEADMKLRAEEQVALSETIKVLNDDDALELFKKTLPGASSSFVQFAISTTSQRKQALAVIKEARHQAASQHPELSFIALALQGKKVSFAKVVTMIDDMVKLLEAEQLDDSHQKEYCEAQFDLSDDKKKDLEHSISGLQSSIAALEESIATMTSEIKALVAGIASLDASVAEATAQRQKEHEEFVELMASDKAAKELLDMAKNRLNKFYNPTLYKAPPTTTLSMEDKLYVEGGGVLPTTPAPGGIAGTGVSVGASFVQISAHSQGEVAPPPPPETMAAYSKKSSESTGVIAMIDMLIKDLSTEMTEAEVTEKNSQAEYVAMMADSKEKRADDSKALSDKGSAKAAAEADLTAAKSELASTSKELMATEKYISSLHAECDWLLKYFDVRAEARAGEVESLKKAKDVLSGADYSLVQTRTQSRRLRGVQ
mmetsp:Transcript_44444/g.73880  ORF Transcript_44444/g.73880 Transcript_44444/m.73880 type:complete len:723 (-) Transcript_44444:95-2263(-)